MLAGALCAGLFTVFVGCNGGCASKLEPGGVYAPTNSAGVVVYNDQALALADASYQFTYETVQSVFKFERDNRDVIWAVSHDVKHGLDKARPVAVDINRRWAAARNAYKKNPTPEGISTLQSILSELNRLLPVVQQQLEPVKNIKTNKP